MAPTLTRGRVTEVVERGAEAQRLTLLIISLRPASLYWEARGLGCTFITLGTSGAYRLTWRKRRFHVYGKDALAASPRLTHARRSTAADGGFSAGRRTVSFSGVVVARALASELAVDSCSGVLVCGGCTWYANLLCRGHRSYNII